MSGSMTRRGPHIALFAMIALSLTTYLVLYRLASQARAEYMSSVSRTAQAQRDVLEMRRLRAAPQLAVERQRPNDELLTQIQVAAQFARIRSDQWIRNEPKGAIRQGTSNYMRLQTQVSLQHITLRQLVQFCHRMTVDDPALHVDSLRCKASSGSQSAVWDVELVIGYLIYAPCGRP